MIRRASYRLLRAASLACLLFAPAPLTATPEHPERAEVMDIYLAMDFRNAIMDDPANVVSKAREQAARTSLRSMNAAFEEWGGGLDGWRYLMGASVYAAKGVGDEITYVMFYNPWVDAAVITEWKDVSNSIDLMDIEWMPGDLLRGTEIEPLPAWMRGTDHPSLAMVAALADTVDAFEARFGDPATAANWRRGLSLTDRGEVESLVSPLVALRVFENQLRLFAIEYAVEGEDPLLQPMRVAVVEFIATAMKDGFGPLLREAHRTPAPLAEVIAQIQPETMQGLAPVAYIADDDEVLIYFASPLTADFVLAATYARQGADLALRVIDFIPYADTYAATRLASEPDVSGAPVERPAADSDKTLNVGKTKGIKKK